jgi:hypothetical protein
MKLRSPDPGTFEHLLTPVDVAMTSFWRLSLRPASEPFWARSVSHRFDDPSPDPAARFGVLYAGESVEVAFCESVIHENSNFKNGRFEVASSEIDGRHLVWFTHPTAVSLTLADLTGDALKLLGLNNDISSGNDYDVPQRWARAIHHAKPDFHGIRFRSRQRNTEHCYALFDRSGLQAAGHDELTDAVKAALCRRFNVVAI